MIVIVPNHLRDAINAKLDKALKDCPEAESERDILFDALLKYYHEHGDLPDFEIQKLNG